MTPYRWQEKPALGWRIGYGVSSLLVAEGSGWSRATGERLFRGLTRDHHQQRRKKVCRFPKRRK